MTTVINKIRDWVLSLFKKKSLALDTGTNLEYNIEKSIEEKKISHNNFKEELRIIESEEEKELIKKFESGEIPFDELTEDILNKINNGYSLKIKTNMERIAKVNL